MSAGVVLLPRYIGLGRATEMLLLGEAISAQKALEIGLVSKVVPPAELDAAVNELSARLAKAATKGIALIKKSLNQAVGVGLEQGLQYQAYATHLALLTEDVAEGKKAFIEKREPDFKSK